MMLSVLLALAVLCGGAALGEEGLHSWTKKEGYSYAAFGSYPQWIGGGNPKEDAWTWSRNRYAEGTAPEVEPSPILWRVLETDGEKALLLSEYCLFTRVMHSNQEAYRTIGAHFEDTDLAEYLRSVFQGDAFTQQELEALLAEEDTGLKVSLPSSKDINNKNYGMGTQKTRKAWATEYAIRVTGTFVYQKGGGQHSPYWMKEQSASAPHAARTTKVDGKIGYLGTESDDIGVRPIIRLDLNKITILGGTGTMEDPFLLGASDQAAGQETGN